MKTLLLLFLVGLSHGASTGRSTPSKSGKVYTYDYFSTAIMGVPGASDNGSGFQMKMTVWVTYESNTRATLEIDGCQASSFLGKYPEQNTLGAFEGDDTTDCSELKKRCLPFDIVDGQIGTIYPSSHEPVRILNIKRAILSAMQGSPRNADGIRNEEETDVLGRCKVEIREASDMQEVFLMKTRDTESCPDRSIEFSTILRESKNQEAKFVLGKTTTNMKFSNRTEGLVPEMIEVYERQSFAPVSKDAGAVVATFRQLLTRKEPSTNPPSNCQPETQQPRSLRFEFPDPEQPVESDVCKAGEVINAMPVAEDPVETARLFGKLIEEMRRCDKTSLTKLSNQHMQCKSPAEDVLRRRHTFFLDALTAVGTDPAIEVIKDLIGGSCLNASRKRELVVSLSTVPLRYSSPCKLLKTSLEIAQANEDTMTHSLVLGAVLRQALHSPKYHCDTEEEAAIDFLESKCRSPNKKQAIHAVKAMGNTGLLSIIPCVQFSLDRTKQKSSDDMDLELRLAAVMALEHLAEFVPWKVRSIVLPIYNNHDEAVEVRVAAFTVYMACVEFGVSADELLDIIKSLPAEPSRYVKSFVYTYLSEIESSDDPKLQEQKEAVAYLMKVSNIHYLCAGCDYGYFSSKVMFGHASLADAKSLPRSLPRDVMGVSISSGFVYTDASNLPRSGTVRLDVNAFGYDINALEIGVRARGTERLIRRLFGPTGYLRLGTRVISPSGLEHPEKMCSAEEEPLWFSGSVKMFGNELAWNRADEEGVNKALYDHGEVSDLRKKITDSVMSTFDFTDFRSVMGGLKDYLGWIFTKQLHIAHGEVSVSKSASLVDVKRSIPTTIGMPLNLTAVAALYTHLNADGDIWLKDNYIELNGHIEPEASVYANMTLKLDCGDRFPQTVHIGTAKTKFRQQATATIQEDYRVDVKINEMPNEPESVVCEVKYRQFAVVDEKELEMGIWKRNETELYEHVGGNFTSIEFITPISYPNSTGVPAAPFFPLSGPAEAKLILRPLTPSPSMLHVKFWNESLLSTDRGTFYATFATDQQTTIDATFDWYTVGEKPTQRRVVNLTANSIPAEASALFHGNTSRRMDIEGWMSLNTSISETWSYVKFNRSRFYGKATRMRIAPDNENVCIKIPEFMCEVNGSLENNTHGNMSAILYLEGSDKPQWLRANFTTIGLMVNITAESSKFNRTRSGYILPYPLKSPTCSYFGRRVITFDGLSYALMTPDCEYVLVRQRNASDNFAVTVSNSGQVINVHINGTKYTLSSEGLKVNDEVEAMPYKQKHVIYIRQVTVGHQTYTRLSAWAGIDIYYRSEGQIHLSINGFYMGQTAGLCSNANYDKSKADELAKPCGIAETTDDFVSSWKANKPCSQPMPTVQPLRWEEAANECVPLFVDAVTDAHAVLDYQSYLEACVHDVAHGHSAAPSVHAYIMAAASKQVAIWFNPDCEKKAHDKFTLGQKICETRNKVTVCRDGCQPVRGLVEKIEARCIGKDDDQSKLRNTSPSVQPYNKILKCK